jgi:hypothetical protein
MNKDRDNPQESNPWSPVRIPPKDPVPGQDPYFEDPYNPDPYQ